MIQHGLHDVFRPFFFGFGFVGEDDAVAEDVHSDVFDVLGDDVAAAGEEGVGFGADGQENRGAGEAP